MRKDRELEVGESANPLLGLLFRSFGEEVVEATGDAGTGCEGALGRVGRMGWKDVQQEGSTRK